MLGYTRSLMMWELAGAVGALLGGTLSDRLGRKTILFVAFTITPFITLLFLQVDVGLQIPVLLLHGLLALSTNAVLMAIVQEHMSEYRAVGNGIYLSLAFVIRPLVAVTIGLLGDNYGLETAFYWGAFVSLLAIPATFFLPKLEERDSEF